MGENKEKRITFRVDPDTETALERYLKRTKTKQSAAVHTALHEFLMAHDPEYRSLILGESCSTPPPTLRVAEDSEDD